MQMTHDRQFPTATRQSVTAISSFHPIPTKRTSVQTQPTPYAQRSYARNTPRAIRHQTPSDLVQHRRFGANPADYPTEQGANHARESGCPSPRHLVPCAYCLVPYPDCLVPSQPGRDFSRHPCPSGGPGRPRGCLLRRRWWTSSRAAAWLSCSRRSTCGPGARRSSG